MNTQAHHIALQGAYNVRDLGGYLTSDGRKTRRGVFFRADSLHRLDAGEQAALLALGLRGIVDLRHAGELERSPNVFAASDRVAYTNISLYGQFSREGERPAPPQSLFDVYQGLLQYSQQPIKQALDLLLTPEAQPALFHCTAGKDRTGVIAALLLDAVGVPHETIAEDYALTSVLIAPLIEELRAHRPPMMTPEQYEPLLRADAPEMLQTLEHLANVYGGGRAYMTQIGISAAQIAHLEAVFVEG